MLRTCILTAAICLSTLATAQTLEKVDERKESAPDKREMVQARKHARIQKMAEEDKLPMVYVALDLVRKADMKQLDIQIEKGDYILGSLLEGMPTPELDQLTKRSMGIRSDIDIINFLSERGWEVVNIMPAVPVEPKEIEQGMRTRVYLRKTFSHEP